MTKILNFIKNLFTKPKAINEYRYDASNKPLSKISNWAKRSESMAILSDLRPMLSWQAELELRKYSYEADIGGDYWKTLWELRTDKKGDCEDLALAYITLRGKGSLIVGKNKRGEFHAVAWDKTQKVVYDCNHKGLIAESSYRDIEPLYMVDISIFAKKFEYKIYECINK
jgi:hypothetical protein